MANDYNASVVISTADSERGIRALDSASKDLDKTLQNLHNSLKNGQTDLDKVSASMKALTDRNKELIKSEQDRAKATVLAAKADGVAIDNQGKRAKTARENAIAEAKVARIRQQTVTGGKSGEATIARRDAESLARITGVSAIAQQNLATATTRTAAAQQNLAGATTRATSAADMAAARTQRLADGSRAAASGTLELNDSLSNSRYLLYDVGQTYTVLAAALQVIPVATAAVAIAYEKDFAQVIRTNDALKQNNGFSELRQDLKELATEIPLTFAEFSNIATIGGQLGIAGNSVEAFTESVARFGAASNVSLDEAATAFGRLQNSYDPMRKDPDFFNKIGSAIAYVGVKSAATETEIIAVNNQIAAAGAQFGFAADEIVGLSGALASVRIRPELARGAFQRIMLGLSRAADEGSESFDKFAKYTGVAGDAAIDLFKSDPSAFFYKYIGGIKGAIKETGSVSAVLDDIGAKNVFDKQFILGLSNGYKVFGDSLGYASSAFNDGTFLKESTQGVFDTMDAKIKRIASSFKNMADTLAKGSIGEGSALTGIADGLLAITGAADRFMQAVPGFTVFLNLVLGLGSAVGILLAFKAAQAFALAGLVGFQQVLGKGTLAAGLTAKGILQQVAVTMLMSRGVTQAHAQALVIQAGAFKAMGMSAAVANAQVAGGAPAVAGVVRNTTAATGAIGRMAGGLRTAGTAMLGLVGGPIGALVLALGAIGLGFVMAEEKANSAGDAIARAMKNGAKSGAEAIGEALMDRKVELNDNIWAGNLGKNIGDLAKEVGIKFDDIVASVAKGKQAGKEFGDVLNQLGRNRGGNDFADALKKGLITTGENQQIKFLADNVADLGLKSAKTAEDAKQVADSATNLGGASDGAVPEVDGLKDAIEGAGDESETAAEKLDKFINNIFGLVDAAGATQSALQQLGESIGESTDFGPGSEGGRANVENFREALKAAALEQQTLIDTTGKSTQQAAADYISFVEGLVAQMAAHGVDPTNVQLMADQAKGYFGEALQAGEQPTIKVQADTTAATTVAATAGQQVQQYLDQSKPLVKVGTDTPFFLNQLTPVANALAEITGLPYQVVIDALTDPAHEKSKEIYDIITSITNKTYTAPIGADTSAAITNVRNFANYASQQLAAVQSAYNNVASTAPTFAKYVKPLFKGVKGTTEQYPNMPGPKAPQSNVSVAQVAAPTQVAPSGTPDFGSLAGGYQKVKDAAAKAGEAGKKAGEDMADGITDATRAADDYANRLKTGLTSAFEMQYGLQKATDDYYSALNAINKKRDDELKQIEDLITAQKELNDERNEELINARKAGIEKDISLKYGEVDRAADYAQQEQEALNAADAKLKDIQANNAQIVSLKAGIGELNGYSQAAIENREAVRNLESKMLDMVVAYAATGASVDQVRAYAQRLTQQFQVDVGQIWNNRVATNALTGEMQRYTDTINRIPYVKPTKIEADTAGAMNNINGLNGAADWAARPRTLHMNADLNVDAYNRKMRSIQQQIVGGGMADDPSMTAFRPGTFQPVYNTGGMVQGFAGGGQIPGKAPSNLSVDNRFASVDGKGLIKVQSEEFIMQKRAVDFWGSDFMNSINAMKMPAFNGGGSLGGRNGGGNSGGAMLVELTAENIAAILRLADRPVDLYAGVEKLASTVAEGNAILASKGVFN